MDKYSSFFWQFGNSFLPPKYEEYDNVDEADTKKFLRIFSVVFYLIFAAIYILIIVKGGSGIENGRIISDEDGYKYSISGKKLKIDRPIYIDDPDKGIFVNITDKVEFFDTDLLMAFFESGYRDVLLISQTNRIKMTSDGNSYSFIVNYFDDMENTSEAGRNNVAPKLSTSVIGLLAAAGIIFFLAYPFIIRLSALILSLVEDFICSAVLKFDPDKEHLKTICVYAFIPAQVIGIIGMAAAVLLSDASSANLIQSVSSSKIYIVTDIISVLLPVVLVTAAEICENK